MTNRKNSFANLLKKRILVLDGAMGTMIQKYDLEEPDFKGKIFYNHDFDLKGNNDILCLTKPDLITEIHEKYLESGCDIIETNTFNANKISQADYHTEECCFDLNKKAAILAEDVSKGDKLQLEHIRFKRTGQSSDLSQVDVIKRIGKPFEIYGFIN